jgi:hypothetical protein
MLNTYIENKGQTQTIFHNKRGLRLNEIKWDANYDGEVANISVSSNTDGTKQHYDFKLDNQDLETMLNIPSVDIPLHNRLQQDFVDSAFRYEPVIYHIELPRKDSMPLYNVSNSPGKKLIQSTARDSYLSSPLPNEELIIPLTINGKKHKRHALTPKKGRFHRKSHKTYKVYKRPKSRQNSRTTLRSRSKAMFGSKNI